MGAVLRLAQDRYVHTDLSASMRPGDTCSAVRVKTPVSESVKSKTYFEFSFCPRCERSFVLAEGTQRSRLLPSRMGCNSKERDVMGCSYRHHRVMRESLKIDQCSYSACFLFQWRMRSDTCVACVTMSDGLALVSLALQAEPRRRHL